VARIALIAMLALLAAACTADGPGFQPVSQRPAGEGLVYVYRPEGAALGRGETPYIEIAGKNMGMLKAGGYVSATLPPGEHDVTVRQTMLFVPTLWDTVSVAVAPGSVSYVRIDQRVTKVGNAGFFSAMQKISIEEVSAEVGQSEIAETRQN
jgi:hypothetical protein